MEIREVSSDLEIIQEPEDFTFPGTNCVISMIRITPTVWAKIERRSQKVVPASKGLPKREIKDEDTARELVYKHSLKKISGLTRRIIEDRFLVVIPQWVNFPIDEEITFISPDIMLKHMIKIGANSVPLNNFIWDRVVPSSAEIQEEEDEAREEKKIS